MAQWLTERWFDLVSTAGIIGSLWVAIISLRSDGRAKRISNLIALTANYLEIRKEFAGNPGLARVVDSNADISSHPITALEESYVNLVIVHTGSTYEALKDELVVAQEGLRGDVHSFFSLPIPKAVWAKVKSMQNRDFAAFIDSSLEQA